MPEEPPVLAADLNPAGPPGLGAAGPPGLTPGQLELTEEIIRNLTPGSRWQTKLLALVAEVRASRARAERLAEALAFVFRDMPARDRLTLYGLPLDSGPGEAEMLAAVDRRRGTPPGEGTP